MKLSRLTGLALLAATAFAAQQAIALTEDDKSMNTSQGAPRFSDPDENTPGQAVYMQGGKAAVDGVDPNSVRYDYDPSTHSYIPHSQ